MQSPLAVVTTGITSTRTFLATGTLPVTPEQKDALCWEALLEDTVPLAGCSHPTVAREGGAP